ncbi:MAG: histidine kinase N-terminal 7TM domain-containing protein, partial [Halobacteria archaeon]|nr:histidine kinase N-terminal 7TM domain-containing protein [Halobacteria archaeon]
MTSLVVGNLLLIISLLLSLAVVYISWKNRPKRGSYTLAAFMIAVTLWVFFHLLEHLSPEMTGPYLEKLRWIGIAPIAFLWIIFVLDYTGREGLLNRR